LTINTECKVKYADIEVVKNSHAENNSVYWTVEIHTKLSKKDAEKLAELIYEIVI